MDTRSQQLSISLVFVYLFLLLILFPAASFKAEESVQNHERTLQDLQRERDSMKFAEAKLPRQQQMMGNLLRDLIHKMKSEGVTRANARSKRIAKRYSDSMCHVDSLGRIQMVLYFRNLDTITLAKLQKWEVRFNVYGFEKGADNSSVVSYFKKHKVPVVPNYTDDPAELDCHVPFDLVEEVANLSCLVRMNAILIRITN